jgi:hypothetical protein
MPNTVIMLSALFGLVVSALAIAFGHGSLFLLFSLTLFAGVLIGAVAVQYTPSSFSVAWQAGVQGAVLTRGHAP